jgi:sigma-54 dependent transcriptional regulator, acetoin dehydrogenase operon transcriptional activator AcoR
MEALVATLRRVIERDIPIMLLGETGTGKEWLARAMQAESSRADRPFVSVHCAAVPEDRLETGLFGAVGADREGSPGGIERAGNGTLFLDDIGDLPLALQARLLRVLQDRQLAGPAGSGPAEATPAVVCASRHDLRPCVERGAFREDLYYHLSALTLRLPALRERSDLPSLVRRVLDAAGGPPGQDLAPGVKALFARHAWPGNVRQLVHVLRAACALAGSERVIKRAHLPTGFLEAAEVAPGNRAGSQPMSSAGGRLEDHEIDLIRRTLEAAGGNISDASKRLGISRNTIYRKLRWKSSR